LAFVRGLIDLSKSVLRFLRSPCEGLNERTCFYDARAVFSTLAEVRHLLIVVFEALSKGPTVAASSPFPCGRCTECQFGVKMPFLPQCRLYVNVVSWTWKMGVGRRTRFICGFFLLRDERFEMWTLNHLRSCRGGLCCVCLLVQVFASSCCLASGFDSALTSQGGLSSVLMDQNVLFVKSCPRDLFGTFLSRECRASEPRSSSCRRMPRLIWNRSSNLVPDTSPQDLSSTSLDADTESRCEPSTSSRRLPRARSIFRPGRLRSWRSTDCHSSER